MMTKAQYVLGFMYSLERNLVLLIEKVRPSWQKGYWNGVGGHIEDDEAPYDAMRREFKEETGIEQYEWEDCLRVLVTGPGDFGADLYIFRAFEDDKILDYEQTTDEQLCVWELDDLPEKVIPNLKWIVPMLIQPIQFPIVITELRRCGFPEEASS